VWCGVLQWQAFSSDKKDEAAAYAAQPAVGLGLVLQRVALLGYDDDNSDEDMGQQSSREEDVQVRIVVVHVVAAYSCIVLITGTVLAQCRANAQGGAVRFLWSKAVHVIHHCHHVWHVLSVALHPRSLTHTPDQF
jgi:hypothetical protein